MVGVVAGAGDIARAVGVGVLVRDVVDQRAFRQRELGVVLREDLAEQLHGGEKLRRGQLLVADHQHRMLDKGAVEPRARRGVDRLAQIEAAHLGAGMRRQPGRSCSRGSRSSLGRRHLGRVGFVALLVEIVGAVEFEHQIAIDRRRVARRVVGRRRSSAGIRSSRPGSGCGNRRSNSGRCRFR